MPSRRLPVLLAAWAVAYNVVHHLGLLPRGLGDAGGGTRWADWLELLTPWAVAALGLAALGAAAPGRADRVLGLVGAGLSLQGAGLHVAANSTSNARGDAAPVHLWDEVVGHGVRYAGVALLAAALVRAAAACPVRVTPVGVALAGLSGLTWATNAHGGDALVLPATAVALALAGLGLHLRRSGAGRLLLVACGVALAGLLLLSP